MLVRPRRNPGVADVSDLSKSPVIKWQHNHYVKLMVFMGVIFPTLVAGLGWGDYWGGLIYAAFCRMVFVHHVRSFVLQLFFTIDTL